MAEISTIYSTVCRSWKLTHWLNISINAREKPTWATCWAKLSLSPCTLSTTGHAIWPSTIQPIPFELSTWWHLKSNGLSVALFSGSQNCLCMPKQYFIPHFPLLSTHPSHFSAHAFTQCANGKIAATSPGLSPFHFWSSPQLRNREGSHTCVCLFMGMGEKNKKVNNPSNYSGFTLCFWPNEVAVNC